MRFYRSFKMSVGFSLAVLISLLINLNFPISAGIITVLNMLDTKKETAKVVWKRIYSSLIGLILMSLIFSLFSFDYVSLIIFIAIIIPILFKLNAREGIAINIVIASHILSYESVSHIYLLNEFSLVITGALIALLMNLHMPNKENKLIEFRVQAESKMKAVLINMSCDINKYCTLTDENLSLDELLKYIKDAKKLSYEYMNNYFLRNHKYYHEYFNMRLQQVYQLMYMKQRLSSLTINQNRALMLSEFTDKLAGEFGELNDGISLLEDVKTLKGVFTDLELPKTKEEFIEWSVLLQYLNDLEKFIVIKNNFISNQLII